MNYGTFYNVMKRKFKQRWSTILQISTKRTITFHLKSLNIKNTMTHDIGNAWDRHKNVAGLNQSKGAQPSPS